MAQRIEPVFAREDTKSPKTKYFSYDSDDNRGFPSPWKAAFPASGPLGYWDAFSRRCRKLADNPDHVVDQQVAKKVWLSILLEYEEYERMGMWVPEEILNQHRRVAVALGWL